MSMVKPNTLVCFVAQLHICLHAEPDQVISQMIGLIILHYKLSVGSACSKYRKKIFSAIFVQKYNSIRGIKALRVLKITGKTLEASLNITYNLHII